MANDLTTDGVVNVEILGLPGRQVLDISIVRALSQRSDVRGIARVAGHFATMAATGTLVAIALPSYLWLVPAMLLHGCTIVTLFAPMHECVHKTAFKSPWLNETIGWVAGALCWYNFTFYRRYHTWHHRYTQDPELDPELSDPKPRRLLDYVLHISGIPFWFHKPRELVNLALGRVERLAYVPPHARRAIAWSARRSSGCIWRCWSPRLRCDRPSCCGSGWRRSCWRSRCCERC